MLEKQKGRSYNRPSYLKKYFVYPISNYTLNTLYALNTLYSLNTLLRVLGAGLLYIYRLVCFIYNIRCNYTAANIFF